MESGDALVVDLYPIRGRFNGAWLCRDNICDELVLPLCGADLNQRFYDLAKIRVT